MNVARRTATRAARATRNLFSLSGLRRSSPVTAPEAKAFSSVGDPCTECTCCVCMRQRAGTTNLMNRGGDEDDSSTVPPSIRTTVLVGGRGQPLTWFLWPGVLMDDDDWMSDYSGSWNSADEHAAWADPFLAENMSTTASSVMSRVESASDTSFDDNWEGADLELEKQLDAIEESEAQGSSQEEAKATACGAAEESSEVASPSGLATCEEDRDSRRRCAALAALARIGQGGNERVLDGLSGLREDAATALERQCQWQGTDARAGAAEALATEAVADALAAASSKLAGGILNSEELSICSDSDVVRF